MTRKEAEGIVEKLHEMMRLVFSAEMESREDGWEHYRQEITEAKSDLATLLTMSIGMDDDE